MLNMVTVSRISARSLGSVLSGVLIGRYSLLLSIRPQGLDAVAPASMIEQHLTPYGFGGPTAP